MGSVGIAITTRNRRDVLNGSLQHWFGHAPKDGTLVVVDDASDEEFWGPGAIRNQYRRGVAMSKNRGIAALMDAGCEHLFLADDDVYPLVNNWWRPYTDSPERHLSYQWPGRRPWHQVHSDGAHFSVGFPRGVMLYVHRDVIDEVGGMDPAHGVWGGEHVEFSQRVHDAGLSSWPYADVCGSQRIWYAHDREHGNTTNSTLPLSERRLLAAINGLQWQKPRPRFVPYREGNGAQDYSLGPELEATEHYALLRHIVNLQPHGIALEFGVGKGESTRIIAEKMPVVGFDWFHGLPEPWREGFKQFMFDQQGQAPQIDNVSYCVGLYEDVAYQGIHSAKAAGLIHIDCDLYSSTKTVLEALARDGRHLVPGTYVVFDEWHGYDGAEQHEQRAWREFADRTGIGWTVVGHTFEQWGIRIV